MSHYLNTLKSLRKKPKKWLITGVAGFIGSNILEVLLKENQFVVGLDNFSTGHKENLLNVKNLVGDDLWKNFCFIEGNIFDFDTCKECCTGIDYVLHQAALGSVPRSIEDPIATNLSNITGFLNMLTASRDESVKSFTYAASSSTYGDHPALPKVENRIGKPLSPYAVTKYVNELYSEVFAMHYSFKSIGLRYFNVFGKRQDPNGSYAAVIPKWIASMINDQEVTIYGDGKNSRDFCYVDNVIQMNILSATSRDEDRNEVYNVALGDTTSLLELFTYLKNSLKACGVDYTKDPVFKDFRAGDVRYSQANINKAIEKLSYDPMTRVEKGIEKIVPWYLENFDRV
tara:strand:- start:818 stop:1846 length:1029 start_codon:yes stop_codon:yes gene_type:complete